MPRTVEQALVAASLINLLACTRPEHKVKAKMRHVQLPAQGSRRLFCVKAPPDEEVFKALAP